MQGELYESTRQTWESIWDGATVATELQTMQYPRAQRTLNAFLPYLSKDAPILEAGSGLGAALITLRRLGYHVIGLDYAVNALRACQAYDPALVQTAGDVHALPFADDSLSAYLSFGVLEHFEHGMLPALREAFRILRPGGVLVMTIPYPNVVWRVAQWRRERQGKKHISEDFYESTYDRDQLRHNVMQAGFEIVEMVPTTHSFTLWGLGGPFRAPGYYRTSALAETVGGLARYLTPWMLNFMTLTIGRKP